MQTSLANMLLFQLSWWAILVSRSQNLLWTLYGVGLVFCFFQLSLIDRHRFRFLALWFLLASLGLTADLLFMEMGFFKQNYENAFWLFPVWLQFSSSLSLSMNYFRSKKWISFFMGAFFGPMTYLGAAKWGVLEYFPSLTHLGLHALTWGILFLALIEISATLEKKYVFKNN